MHRDVVKHQTTRHKTPEIVIAYVLLLDWKNKIFRAKNVNFLIRIIIHCQKLEILTFPPFFSYNKQLFFQITDEGTNNWSQTYIECLYVRVCW